MSAAYPAAPSARTSEAPAVAGAAPDVVSEASEATSGAAAKA